MSETRFTPGPWVWRDKSLHSAHGTVIEHQPFEGMWFGRFNGEDAANAHLIAAAPDLYSALDDAYAILVVWADSYRRNYGMGEHNHPTHQGMIDQAKSALAKARGEQ